MMVTANPPKQVERIHQIEQVKKPGISYAKAEPCWASKEDVSSIAEQIAKAVGFEIGGDLVRLTEELHGKIVCAPLHLWTDVADRADGAIWVHGKHDFTILISTLTAPIRDRFTIAHELGHYFLHSIQGEKPIVADRGSSKRVEWEANWFAAAFLMPEGNFKDQWHASRSGVSAVARIYNVSAAAVRIRAIALGLDS